MNTVAIASLRLMLVGGGVLAALPALAQTTPSAPAAHARDADDDDDDDRDGDRDGGHDIVVSARRLDQARDSIQPAIGANATLLDRQALDSQVGGADRALNAVLLQAPGVTQDSDGDGEVHIRNEHANIQYRLNGVTVPDTISGFGPLVDTRVADSIEILTGALPAQYGERTAGVVQLKTRTAAFDADGDVGIYGGAHGTIQPSATYRNSFGKLNVFVSGSYYRTDLGLAAPTSANGAIHDTTEQYRGFGYFSYLIDDKSRLTLFGGSSTSSFQIPNTPGQVPLFTLNGRATFDSAQLDQNQRNQTHFGVLAYQYSGQGWDVQIAPTLLWARARFLSDPNGGELLFNGVDGNLTQTNLSYGLQADASVKLGTAHTLRLGLFAQHEHNETTSLNHAFPVDDTLDPGDKGYQLSDVPRSIPIESRGAATTLAAYVQDEWRLTPTLTLNLGLRYDRFHWQLTEDQLSPRASLVWKPDAATTIHLGYARNFTPPPLALIGAGTVQAFVGTSAAAGIGNAAPVRAEREHQFDIGAERKFGPLTLGLDSYYKIKRNLLDDTQYGQTELLAPFNYASGYGWGVEFSANYEHGPWEAYANVARGAEKARRIVSNQFFFEPDELAYIAHHDIFTDHSQDWTVSGGVSLRVQDGLGQLQPSAELIYGSGLRRTLNVPGAVPNGATQQAYAVVNLGLSQAIGAAEHAWTVRVDVTNLFDKSYLVHDGSGIGAGQPQYGARRAVMCGLRKSF